METKYTPGPWQVGNTPSKYGSFNANHVTACSNDEAIAMVYGIPQNRTVEELMDDPSERTQVGIANAQLIAAAPLMHMALEAHAAWHWAENTNGVSTFHENMELANYSQWLTARALAQAAGLPHTEDFSGVPRMLIGFDGLRIDRASEKTAQAIVDRLIGEYRAAIAKATGTK